MARTVGVALSLPPAPEAWPGAGAEDVATSKVGVADGSCHGVCQ